MKRKITSLTTAIIVLLMLFTWPTTVQGQTRATATLTNAEIVAAGDPASGYNSYAITGGGGKTWNVYAIKNFHSKATNDKYYLQIRAKQSTTYYYVQVPEYGTKITSITMTVSNSSQPMTGGGNTATLFFSNSNQTSATGTGVVSGTGDSSVTIDCSSLNLNTGYITASGAVRIWDVEVTYNTSAPTTVETPVITLDAGTYTGNQSTTITCGTASASIYYTLDGTTPSSSNGTLYEGAITIDHSCTLKAIGIKDGLDDSEVVEAAYTIKMATPTFSPVGGTYDATQSVTLSSTAGATIYYTLDGSNPSTTSSVYSSALSITSTKTIKAYAVKANCTDSDVATATYTLKAQTPTFSPAANTYVGTQSVSINCATDGVTIYYTTNGDTPTTSSSVYSSAISVSSSQTLKAIAVKDNLENSDVASASYTIHQPLTTMDEIFAAAVAGEGNEVEYYVTFNNWVVTGVSGSQAFVTDGAKGFVIYKSGHGFTVGKIISGTTTNKVKIKVYNEFAEFTNLTTSTSGISVTSGGTVSPQVVTIGDLSGVNTGAVITLNGLVYDEDDDVLSDGANVIKPYTTLYSGSYTDGSTYNITGVYQQQSSAPHRILPRSDADIVEVVDPVITAATSLAVPNYVVGATSSAITYDVLTINGSNLTANITVALKDGESSNFEISDDLDTWGYSVEISKGSGTVSNAEIAVRLKSDKSENDYSDQINLTSTGATTVNVNVTGSVYYAHVTYNGNGSDGGSAPTDSNDYEYEDEVTVLGQNTLTRTGYDFVWWNTEADGTGDDYAEDESFYITENVTLYAMWDAITYDIGKSAMTNGNVTFQVGGEAATTAKTDQTVTIVVTPSAGYILNSLTVTNNATSAAVEVNNSTFTMPGSHVTVSATFISGVTDILTSSLIGKTSYANWSGKSYDEHPAVYAGNSTQGGSSNSSIQMRGSDNSGIVSTTSGGKARKISVTWNSSTANGRILDVYGKNTAYTASSNLYSSETYGTLLGSITYSTGNYSGELLITNDYDYIGVRSRSNALYLDNLNISWAPTYTVTYNANAEGATGTTSDANKYVESATVTAKANGFTHPSSYTFNSWNTAADGSGTTYAPAATFTMGTANVTLYAQWNRNDLPVNGSTHELESSTTVNVGEVVTVSSEIIIPNGITLTVDGTLVNTTAANLIVEDGGQLIASNPVMATVKKNVANANGSKAADNHWYTIATPVHTGINAYVPLSTTNLTSITDGKYDMFYLDEATNKWMNQKNVGGAAGYPNMYIGKGYLYRNDGTPLSMPGKTMTGDTTIAITKTNESPIEGINLIGNPFTHNIYKGYQGAIDDAALSDNFHYLADNGTWQLGDYKTAITPGMGIVVQTNTAKNLTIKDDATKATAEHAPTKAESKDLKFFINGNNYEDAAYAVLSNGYGLLKMSHPNEAAPLLYISQNDKSFSVANMSADTRSFNLCHKAKTTGRYTLSYKANGEFNYLHIIDRITGEDVDMLLDGEYSFIASPNDSNNRFIVKLGYNAANNANNDIFAYQNGNDIVVEGEGELQVFDVTGRQVKTQRINGVQTINLNNQGVYIFRLNEKTQKIVVK